MQYHMNLEWGGGTIQSIRVGFKSIILFVFYLSHLSFVLLFLTFFYFRRVILPPLLVYQLYLFLF